LTRIQKDQKTHRDNYKAQQLPWDAREQSLVKTMDNIGEGVSHASYLAEGIATGELPRPVEIVLRLDKLEDETQLWELPALLAESSKYQREPAPGVKVEGWLYKKSSSRIALQQWNRRWFMMDKDGIYYFRTSAEMKKVSEGHLHTLERVKICDVILCTVKEIAGDGPRFCFEIITPNQRPLVLQARGPLEYKLWVEGIRSTIQHELVSGDGARSGNLMQNIGKQKKKRGDSAPNVKTTLASMLDAEIVSPRKLEQRMASDGETRFDDTGEDDRETLGGQKVLKGHHKNPMVQQIMEENPICADCGVQNPDWASLNLGVLVCIQCSGVHRSMGVHVSKVRSLKLDSLTESEARLLLALGNDRVNPIWESGVALQQGWTKPGVDSSRQVKESWIKSKYHWKGFLEDHAADCTSPEERNEKLSRLLYDAARDADLLGVVEALAHGGSVTWRNPEEDGKTALHACAISRRSPGGEEWQGIECAELLCQNGAKLDVLDNNTQSVLDCAVIGNGEREMIEYLSAKK
jgi:hypothetical protein